MTRIARQIARPRSQLLQRPKLPACGLKWGKFLACDRAFATSPFMVLRRFASFPLALRWLVACLLAISASSVWTSPTAMAQSEVKIWEFSPYEVEVFYLFDADVGASPIAQQIWLSQVQADLERTFRAAWHVRLTPLRSDLAPLLLRRFDSFTIADLQAQPAVAELQAIDDSEPQGAPGIPSDPDLQGDSEQVVSQSPETGQEPIPDGNQEREPLGRLASDSSSQTRAARRTSLWYERDKLFFLRVSRQGDETALQVRELDGPLRFFGPTLKASTVDWSYAARLASATIANAFAPVARVEDAASRTAELRLRAGGLILRADNPATVGVGDVMQPVVRRDDRNGVPVLLQPLPWTYAAVTASDGVKLEANVYTYSGGPGLQGRKNRRTQRMLLKVRPQAEQTDLELVLRNSAQPQAGCFIYSRDLLTNQFELLGRTDWRGRLTIDQPLLQVQVLPEAVRAARAAAKRAAAAAAQSAAAQAEAAGAGIASDDSTEEAAGPGDSASEAAGATAESRQPASDAAALAQDDSELIPLRVPLLLLYVKQGSAVLAMLPVVPGLELVETAELPDDQRRLLAEAFVRGFQGEILDVVGMRNLLAAKVKQQVAQDQRDAAKATVEELRQLKNYTQMADELEAIQRRMLDETDGPIPLAAKNRIDGMFQATRTMLQKYLQDDLMTQSEQAVAAAAQPEPQP